MAFKNNRVGEKHITNEGYTIEIVEYFNWRNCTVRFNDGTLVKNRTYQNIVNGEISHPYHKSVYGIGYFGIGKHSCKVHNKAYKTWLGVMQRCYSDKYGDLYPTYIGCSVDERWHNFQNFAEWFEENYKEGFELDKDILQKGNKTYSSNTCCFVSHQINSLLIKSNSIRGKYPIGVHKSGNKFKAQLNIDGKRMHLGLFNTVEEAFQVYKLAKEKQIKKVADKWKDQIKEKVYQALINYSVEITD